MFLEYVNVITTENNISLWKSLTYFGFEDEDGEGGDAGDDQFVDWWAERWAVSPIFCFWELT